MFGYHYSPVQNRKRIKIYGLLVPKKHPVITTPVVCSEGHRNPHISLARDPQTAWSLSGGFLVLRANEQGLNDEIPEDWDLYQVDLRRWRYKAFGDELQSRADIPRSRVRYVGSRRI